MTNHKSSPRIAISEEGKDRRMSFAISNRYRRSSISQSEFLMILMLQYISIVTVYSEELNNRLKPDIVLIVLRCGHRLRIYGVVPKTNIYAQIN